MRAFLLSAVLACSTFGSGQAQDFGEPPAGTYRVDPSHANLLAFVDHLGMSDYLIRFTRFEADMVFDPDHPEAMSVEARIDAASLRTGYPRDDIDFDAVISGPDWLNAETYPQIGFRSTSVTVTGPATADVTGLLTLMGVEREILLSVTYNGGYAGIPALDPQGRVGFSATAHIDRSYFGLDIGVPTPDFNLGVGDRVEIRIELELLGPALPEADTAPVE